MSQSGDGAIILTARAFVYLIEHKGTAPGGSSEYQRAVKMRIRDTPVAQNCLSYPRPPGVRVTLNEKPNDGRGQ